jgi:hypothetical protein
MTIYYLLIKTHNKTGLKYLCKTTQDPYTYKGSGKDWKTHLKKFGYDHSTVIIRECISNEEISIWGRYYSNIYKVTTAADNYGNKIWANIIPETGAGPGGKAGVPRSEKTKAKIRQNMPEQSVEKNSFYRKTHTEENKKTMGDVNRGKDIKTEKGKESIRESMIARWEDPIARENQIIALKNRKGEKRSEKAKESYRKSAKERNEKMTPEQRSARTKAGCETKKIKYAGLTRKKYIDEDGKVRYRWIPSTPDKGQS